MAEKFMTRRERREAERRQADAAYDAQQAAKAEEVEAPVPESPATPGPEALAPEAPAAPPRLTTEPGRVSAFQPEPVKPDPAPASDPAPVSDAAPVTEPPRFSSRSERKRFLREHDLPSDIATASIPIVLAQRASGTAPAEAAETPEAVAPADTAEATTAAAPAPAPAEAAAPAEVGEPRQRETGPESQSTAEDSAEALARPQDEPLAVDAPTGTDEDSASLFPSAAPAVGSGPQFDLASRRVDAHTTGPDFETSSTAVITPSALGDFDQPIKRRSPVVKPPTGSNIRVVTGALPIVTQQDLEANPPTTPMSAIDADALAADDRGTGTFRTSESPVFRASRPVSDPWAQLGDSAVEEEEDSDELEEPPARPMSARSVTNEDGTVLVAERNSMVPFIVLGATGFAALVLVIVAITLLF